LLETWVDIFIDLDDTPQFFLEKSEGQVVYLYTSGLHTLLKEGITNAPPAYMHQGSSDYFEGVPIIHLRGERKRFVDNFRACDKRICTFSTIIKDIVFAIF
jgi:hypothetical protein